MKRITKFILITCLTLIGWQGYSQNGGDTCATAVLVAPAGQSFTDTVIIDNGNAWFVYTPTMDGNVNINSCGGGADSDLEIYIGDCGSQTFLASNDDACASGLGNNFASKLDFSVTANTEYYIKWLDSYNSSTNPFDWLVTFTLPPANDTCATATDLALETSPLMGSITSATTASETLDCGLAAGRDLFYQILVPDTFEFSFNQTVNNFDSVHNVAYGGTCPGVNELECLDGNEFTITEWTNDTGADQIVYIVIEGYFGTSLGDFTFQWSVTAPPSCPDVLNITAIPALDGSAALDWDDVATATAYIYEIQNQGTAQGSPMPIDSGSPTTSEATVAAGILTAGETYTLYVASNCGGAIGNYQSIDFTAPTPGSSCVGGIELTPGIPQAGDSAGQPGDFPGVGGGSPANPCSSGYNDDEYWFEYTATEDGEKLMLEMTDISDNWAGLFVLDNCPDSAPNCIANDTNNSSTADLALTTPPLVMNTSYKIVITNNGTPNSTSFVLNSTVIPAPDCSDITNLSASTQSDGSVDLDWDDALNAAGYNFEIQPQDVEQGTAGALVMDSSTNSDAIVSSGILTESTVYTLYVQSDCGSMMLGDFQSINFTYSIPPVNNNCDNPTTITASTDFNCTNQVSGTTQSATISAPDGCSTTGKDVWYEFTPTLTSEFAISVTETNEVGFNSTYVSVYYGVCGMLTQEGTACSSTSFNGSLTQGVTYLINVRSSSTTAINYVDFNLCLVQIALPENDECTNATPLTVNSDLECTIVTTGTNVGATASSEPEDAPGTADDDVWYSFTAEANSHQISLLNKDAVIGTSTDMAMAVYDATNGCGMLTEVAESDPDSFLATGLTIGTSYLIRVYGFLSGNGSAKITFDLCVGTQPSPPANDTCASPTAITASTDFNCTNQVSGTTQSATTSAPDGCSTTGKDVWYEFTPTVTNDFVISVTETNEVGFNSTYVSVYSGDCGTLIQEGTACSSTSFNGSLTQGVTYLVNVRSSSTTATNYVVFDLCIVQITAPENDECTNATPLTVNSDLECTIVTTGTNVGATASSEPEDAPGTADDDVWYSFTAEANSHQISLLNKDAVIGTSTDMAMAVYDATNGCGMLTEVAESDPDSFIATGLTIGTSYLIRVYGFFAGDGSAKITFDLCVGTQPPPPSNIDCTNATSIAYGQTIEDNSTQSTGTAEDIGCDMGVNGLWYTFVGNGGDVTISSGASFDHRMAIGSGACGTLMNIVCDDESTGIESHTFATTLNETYYIYIAHYINNNTTTGDLFVSLTGVSNIWDGTVWSLGTPPTLDQNAVIAGTFDTTDDGNIDAGSLEINATQTLTVNAGDFINIAGDISILGTLDIEHTGSVVQQFDTALTFNNGTTTVNVTTPTLQDRQFMILGSPMEDVTESVFNGAYQVLNHDTDLYTMYDDAPIAGINFYDDDANDLAPFTGTLNPAEGYIVRPSFTDTGSYDYVFTNGNLNSGDITYTAGYNGNKDDSANFLSNPYPSAIDANLFLLENSGIVGEIYFWEHLTPPGVMNGPYGDQNFSMEDVSTYNNMGGAAAAANGGAIPTNIIATAQGFGIKANAGGSVKFTNAMRVTTGNTTLRSSLDDANRLWLSVREEASNAGSSNLIGFTSAATAGLDYGFDTEKIGTAVSLYSHLQDGTQNLSIQSREAFDSSMTIPMGFSTYFEEELSYTISILNMDGDEISNATVFLIDNHLGTTTNLNQGDYVFTSTGATYDNRFTVVFENGPLGINDVVLTSIAMYPNPGSEIINIASPNAAISSIEVRDIRGRVVLAKNISAQNNATINVANLDSAVYLVTIATDKGAITNRLIKE